jgi:hypothetical protein
MRGRIHTLAAGAVLALGIALMTMMIVVESEPGALPLLLVAIGGTWLAVARLRLRRASRDDR